MLQSVFTKDFAMTLHFFTPTQLKIPFFRFPYHFYRPLLSRPKSSSSYAVNDLVLKGNYYEIDLIQPTSINFALKHSIPKEILGVDNWLTVDAQVWKDSNQALVLDFEAVSFD